VVVEALRPRHGSHAAAGRQVLQDRSKKFLLLSIDNLFQPDPKPINLDACVDFVVDAPPARGRFDRLEQVEVGSGLPVIGALNGALLHSRLALTERHYRTKATKLKPVR
jgi:hypothetical protein